MFHPFYIKGKDVADSEDISYNSGEWKAASNLSAGDELLTEDGKIVYVREVRIERLEESIKVYNLEVEGLHTYYVDEGVLVHNMCGGDVGSNQNPDLYHYTDENGAMSIEKSGIIKCDSRGRIFVTTDVISSEDAINALFMGRKKKNNASYRVEIYLMDPDDINLTTEGCTQPNELIYKGTLRNGKNAIFVVKENDF